jgi:hypothetical protein
MQESFRSRVFSCVAGPRQRSTSECERRQPRSRLRPTHSSLSRTSSSLCRCPHWRRATQSTSMAARCGIRRSADARASDTKKNVRATASRISAAIVQNTRGVIRSRARLGACSCNRVHNSQEVKIIRVGKCHTDLISSIYGLQKQAPSEHPVDPARSTHKPRLRDRRRGRER